MGGFTQVTKPKMVQCPGNGQEVYGPDEPTGTVFCNVCGNSILPMKTTVIEGKGHYSVPEHQCRANPMRRKGVKKAPNSRRVSRRSTSRR